jgi:hypothetical protein
MTPLTYDQQRAITRDDFVISPVQAAVMRRVLLLIAGAEFDPNVVTPLEFGVALQEMALSTLIATTPKELIQ